MELEICGHCGGRNRAGLLYCMRCGKFLPQADSLPAQHARAFVQRELAGPFFSAWPGALDFSANSLGQLDALITEMWGAEGLAPGTPDWQPPPGKLQIIVNFGAYLGEVLCRLLPARWVMDPQQPDSIIAARVVDSLDRRINTFAQIAARFRDGQQVSLARLLAMLRGLPVPATPGAAAAPTAPPPKPPPPPPSDPQQLLREADAAAAAGLTERAIACYRELLKLKPAHLEAGLQLTQLLALQQDITGALAELERLRKLHPADPQIADHRAMVLTRAGRYDEALGTLEMALVKSAGNPMLMRRRALVRLHAKQWQRAADDLRALLQHRAEDAEVRFGLAHALHELGQSPQAIAELRRILTLPPVYRPATLETAVRQRLAELGAG